LLKGNKHSKNVCNYHLLSVRLQKVFYPVVRNLSVKENEHFRGATVVTVPYYQERGYTFAADTCQPVVQAVQSGQIRHEALSTGHYPGRRLPRNLLPGVKTIGFWDATCPQNWGLDWHRNEGVELTFLESGSLGFSADDRDFLLKPSDLTFTRPWQQHRVGNPHIGAGRLHFCILDLGVRRPHQTWRWPSWIVLTPDDLRQLTDMLRQNEQPVWQVTPEIGACFRRIATAVENDNNGSRVSALAVHLNQLLLLLLEMFRKEDVPLDASLTDTRRTVELFWTELQQHEAQLTQEWTVATMARHCGIGVTHFTHYTKLLTNRTPMQYLGHCRLRLAAEMLEKDANNSITDVALRCGFGSSQYFATSFRREFGTTPRAWQSQREASVLG
jgi:AraC family L-rhamnose operon regulatory protein RhaS